VIDRPTCDWWVSGTRWRPGRRCLRQASFRWGKRFMCANHAASWLRAGYVMDRLPGVRNPYPGNEWLWNQTREAAA
jgi:hypothetical protein